VNLQYYRRFIRYFSDIFDCLNKSIYFKTFEISVPIHLYNRRLSCHYIDNRINQQIIIDFIISDNNSDNDGSDGFISKYLWSATPARESQSHYIPQLYRSTKYTTRNSKDERNS
jgi:hypothetical protein